VLLNDSSCGDAAAGVVGNTVLTLMQSESCRRRPDVGCVWTSEPGGSKALYPSRDDAGNAICGTTSTAMVSSTIVEFSGADLAMLLTADATIASMKKSKAVKLY